MFLNQFFINFIIFILSLLGLIFNRRSLIIALVCIELVLLSLNLNFITFSVYLDDFYGQIFALFILTVAASESAIGLALTIIYYRIRGDILLTKGSYLRY